MQRAHNSPGAGPVSEMAIVDTFTKLIFGEEVCSQSELSIIQAFRETRPDVLRDSHLEMGEYLRNLGVREMIALVVRMREQLCGELELPAVRGQHAQSLQPRQSR